MGQTTSWRGIERNGVWRNLVSPGNRTVHTPEEQARFESLLVADLRMTAARYPAGQRQRKQPDLDRDAAAEADRPADNHEAVATAAVTVGKGLPVRPTGQRCSLSGKQGVGYARTALAWDDRCDPPPVSAGGSPYSTVYLGAS